MHPENARPYDVQLGRLGVDVLGLQGRDWFTFSKSGAQPGCRFFPETGHNVCGDILATWLARGIELDGVRGKVAEESIALFGLPISDLQVETIAGQEFQVQWFERARFELHPENAPPYNVLLGLLGSEIRKSSPPENSSNGRIIFESTRDGHLQIYAMNDDGTGQVNLTNSPANDMSASWSPDGSRIAFVSDRDHMHEPTGAEWEIYVMNADGSGVTRLTNNRVNDMSPVWSPDGSRIVFSSHNDNIYVMNTDGSRNTQLTDNDSWGPSWTPDGTHIVFGSYREGEYKTYIMNADGTSQMPFVLPGDDGYPGYYPYWSSDGHHIAFTIHPTEQTYYIYTINSDGSNRNEITAGGWVYDWSPDGSQLAFGSGEGGANYWDSDIYVINIDGTNRKDISNYHLSSDRNADWSPVKLPRLPTPELDQPPPNNSIPCPDVPDPVSAVIRPGKCVYQGDVVSIDISGFQPNEEFINRTVAPDGRTGSQDGRVRVNGNLQSIRYDTRGMPNSVGTWEVSFEGKTSGHRAVIRFKVLAP